MATNRRHLVRRVDTPGGPRYVVQVPEPDCPIPGWRAYAVLVTSSDGEKPLHLTLYERDGDGPEEPDAPQAA